MTTNLKENKKLKTLLEIEKTFKNEIEYNQPEKEKYFITFPYPYMNGKLHLGHLFSFSKSEFMARYKKIRNYDVFFPLSFHGSGMPISAASDKLKKEDQEQIEIMKLNGITDIESFKDPYHWLTYFPPLAKKCLIDFHSYVNWNHSFVTTEMNPFYDSFVKWQFKKLEKFISFGKKETIFCPDANQPCLDHDRRTGEGVIPLKVNMEFVKVHDVYIIARMKENTKKDEKKPTNNKNNTVMNDKKRVLSLNLKTKHYKIEFNDKICIVDDNTLQNMKYQEFNFELLNEENILSLTDTDEIKINFSQVENALINKENKKSDKFTLFLPEKEVIARTQSKCVVSLFEQYFLDYDRPEWKKSVLECIEEMDIHNETRKMLIEAVHWIDKWGFSRIFGIGTKYKEFLIDSLSDSTIYMALYTVRNELFGDLYGKEYKLDVRYLTDDAWDYIFDLNTRNPYTDQKGLLLERARTCFKRYYPVDLRVSGKDLIKNHLIFYLFNHVAIFPKKYWPKRIFTNGHLMLNNMKMSKSEGNFLSAEDSIKLYGVNVSRIVLADAGDFNEDANFSESLADSYVLKLHSLVQFIESHCLNEENDFDQIREKNRQKIEKFCNIFKMHKYTSKNIKFSDQLLVDGINFLVNECEKNYESMSYRNVVKYGFHEFKTLLELCISLNASDHAIIYAIKINLQILYPILPSLSEYFLEKYFDKNKEWPIIEERKESFYKALDWYKKLFKNIHHKMNKSKKNKIRIFIGNKKPEWKIKVDTIDKKEIKELHNAFKEFGISPKKGMSYVMDYIEYYFDEKAFLFGMKEDLERKLNLNVDILEEEGRGEPYEPEIEFY